MVAGSCEVLAHCPCGLVKTALVFYSGCGRLVLDCFVIAPVFSEIILQVLGARHLANVARLDNFNKFIRLEA